jgi:hypothetical protein
MRWLWAVLLAAACIPTPARGPSLTASPEVCRATQPFCLPARDMELLLREVPLSLRASEPVGTGKALSQRLLIAIPGGPVIRAKWKTAGRGGDGPNRSPRKELAAYALQKLFLDEDDYVVPPTVARCMPAVIYRMRITPVAIPTFEGTQCVLGTLSYWIEDARQLEGFSSERYSRDPEYRRSIALLNVLTHLIDHRDTKPQNFVVSRDRRAFSVDNGLAFSGWRTPRGWFLHEWQDVLVDGLPRELVQRLRRVSRADLLRLQTVAQFRVDRGQLHPVALEGAFDPHEGVRRRGDQIQIGLTWEEIDSIGDRLHAILERVESGELKVY